MAPYVGEDLLLLANNYKGNIFEADRIDAVSVGGLTMCYRKFDRSEGLKIHLNVIRRWSGYLISGYCKWLGCDMVPTIQYEQSDYKIARQQAIEWVHLAQGTVMQALSAEIEYHRLLLEKAALKALYELQEPNVIAASQKLDDLIVSYEFFKKRQS